MTSARTTHELLQSLQAELGTNSAAVVQRLLRVPPVWSALHRGDRLDHLVKHHGAQLQPAAALTLADVEVAINSARRENLISSEAEPTSLEDMAILAAYAENLASEPADLIQWLQQSAPIGAWSLACAWPTLDQKVELLATILAEDKPPLYHVAWTALNANLAPEDAGALLIEASPNRIQLLLALGTDREDELANAVAAALNNNAAHSMGPSIEEQFALALADHALGRAEAAQDGLEAVWQSTDRRAAAIADQLAVLAEERADTISRLQARERALSRDPSLLRRAELALAALENGEPMQAAQVVPAPYNIDEERIAAARVNLSLGQIDSAREVLSPVTAAALTGRWRELLSAAWLDLDQPQPAVQALQTAVRDQPQIVGIRARLADLLLQTGDPQGAADQAALVTLFNPDNQQTRRVLAESLQRQGRQHAALDEWLAIAKQDPGAKSHVVECALAADETGTALTFAQQLMEQDPNSAVARTAIGKAMLAAGNPEVGRKHLRRATDIAPEDASAWIALARAEADLGEEDVAGSTLKSAVQACPSDAELHAAYADWLLPRERHSEALEHAEKALNLRPDSPDCILRCAELQRDLGRPEQARPLYEKAFQLRPADEDIRLALGELYEAEEQWKQATEVLGEPSEQAPARSHALQARLLIRTRDDEQAAKGALAALARAEDLGLNDPSLTFWSGRAKHMLGDYQAAMQDYQACAKSLPEDEDDLREQCLCAQAKTALVDGQAPLAISVLESARDSGLATAPILTMLSQAYQSASLADESFSAAAKAVKVDPEHPQARQQLVTAAEAAGAWEELIQRTEAWSQDTEDDPFVLPRSRALHQVGRTAEARSAIAQHVWRRRQDPKSLLPAAVTLLSIAQSSAAQRLLLTAKTVRPDDPEILAQLAQAAWDAEDFETAHKTWLELAELEPDNDRALVGAADALWQLDRRAASIGLLQRAVQQRPQDGTLHAKLAEAQLDNGEVSQALEHFRKAVRLSPEDTDTAWRAGSTLLRHGAARPAVEVLNALLKQQPEHPDALLALAEGHLRLGEAREALATIERLPRETVSAACHALRALASRALEQDDEAQRALEQALAAPSTSRDLRWQLQAALAFGRWQAVEKLLADAPLADPDAVNWIVRSRARLADAHWLVHEKAGAEQHGPDQGVANATQEAKLLATIGEAQLPEPEKDQLELVVRLSFGELPADELQAPNLQQVAEPWSRALAVDGWIIALLKTADPERALEALSNWPTDDLDSNWSPLLAGLAHLQNSRFDLARKAFGAISKGSPLHPLAARFTAEAWQGEGRRAEAINALNSAVLAWPEETRWQHELANAYIVTGKAEAALPHLQEALEQSPGDATVQADYARALKLSGQLSEAETAYSKSLPAHEDDHEFWREAGEVALALGDLEQAQRRFSHALELDAEDTAARIGAARATLATGAERESRKHIDQVLRQPPTQAATLVELAEVLMEQDRDDKAMEVFDKALRTAERPLSVHRARSSLLLKRGRAQEAIKALQRVVEADPGDDQAWYALAQGYELAGKPEDAVDAIRMAIQSSPASARYRLYLAKLQREAGQLDQALSELTELEQQEPARADVAFELGRVHYQRRQLQKALRSFERAIQLNKDSAAAHYHAGMVLKALKAYGKAATMFKQAAELNPNDSNALHQLAAVQALDLVHGNNNQQAATAVTP